MADPAASEQKINRLGQFRFLVIGFFFFFFLGRVLESYATYTNRTVILF